MKAEGILPAKEVWRVADDDKTFDKACFTKKTLPKTCPA
jgi:hypothetical protein